MDSVPLPPAPPEGLIVDLVTPLTEAGGLDTEGLTRLVARVLPWADGILAGGPGMGEALDLPLETRLELLSHLLPAVAGKVTLFFGITGGSEEETQELAEAVKGEVRRQHYPGPFFLADLPLWYHSNRGLPQSYQRLLGRGSFPLMLLNQPEVIHRRAPLFKHRNIRTQVFKKLASLPGVVGLFYQGEMRRFLNYHYAAVNRPGFAFYEASEVNFLTRPGAWGVLSASAQLAPRAWQRVTRACLHPEEVEDDQERRLELWDLSQRLLEIAKLCQHRSPGLLKGALRARGVLASAATVSGAPAPTAAQKEEVQALVLPLTD
jgi:dihydrodipicolinate synthase/N-acetylneuraminate lyase